MKEIVISNGLYSIITQALEEMKSEQGNSFRLEKVILSELEHVPEYPDLSSVGSKRMDLKQ